MGLYVVLYKALYNDDYNECVVLRKMHARSLNGITGVRSNINNCHAIIPIFILHASQKKRDPYNIDL